ncbi:hypothetical protein CB0940_00690 [Cercospora beticola]|uniref:Uncharacterized protein n=1 Tax=Cercospora beticola TaxID=122368 RepID=A0A2G5I916_CERBT|nr:hypothetical protein CB0940_00690 [Cercospora beticola]PIB00973.1 hypothetical protein CB0940_00690 [Cercospora beticola]
MLKDDFSGLVDTAAEGEFIRIIAELYEYVSSDNRREWEFSPGLADTPFAGYAMQLGNKSGIKVVYIRQGLLSSRLGPFVPDGLTEVVRQIYHKAMRHRVTSPDLYDGTVLLSEAEDLAGALYQHTLGPSSGTACQPCLDSEAIALSGRCRVVGCSRSFPSADRLVAEPRRKELMATHTSTEDDTSTPRSFISTKEGLLILPRLAIRTIPLGRSNVASMITDTTTSYELHKQYTLAGGAIDNSLNVITCLSCCKEILRSNIQDHSEQSPRCRTCDNTTIPCASCELQGLTCGKHEAT